MTPDSQVRSGQLYEQKNGLEGERTGGSALLGPWGCAQAHPAGGTPAHRPVKAGTQEEEVLGLGLGE